MIFHEINDLTPLDNYERKCFDKSTNHAYWFMVFKLVNTVKSAPLQALQLIGIRSLPGDNPDTDKPYGRYTPKWFKYDV